MLFESESGANSTGVEEETAEIPSAPPYSPSLSKSSLSCTRIWSMGIVFIAVERRVTRSSPGIRCEGPSKSVNDPVRPIGRGCRH